MQTFLPFEDFPECAACLDTKRLGNQRVETFQILSTLSGASNGWKNHPNVQMWANSELWLISYGLCMCYEWQRRGYEENMHNDIASFTKDFKFSVKPDFLGNSKVHDMYKGILYNKKPDFYTQFQAYSTLKVVPVMELIK